MSFIVCPAQTVIFRVEITSMKVVIARPRNDVRDVHVRGNFDNYRSYISPKTTLRNGTDAVFDAYTSLFIYETRIEPLELLVSKTFSVDVYGGSGTDDFIGQAAIDILTLATGPRQVSLSIFDGDSPVGRLSFCINMADMTDTVVWMEELQLECVGVGRIDDITVTWTPNNDVDDDHAISFGFRAPDLSDPNKCKLRSLVPHRMELTLNALYAGAGVVFRVYSKECCFSRDVGSATVLFVDGIKDVAIENQVRKVGYTFSEGIQELVLPPTVPAPGAAPEAAVAVPASGQREEKRSLATDEARFERAVDFRVETTGGQDNSGESFILSGRIWLSKIPKFAQMVGGMTVDGVVCGGKAPRGNLIAPPFTDTHDSGI